MFARRVCLYILAMLFGLGGLAASAGYARYLRSSTHLREIEADLSELLQLPILLTSVTPISFDGARFGGVSAHLAGSTREVFRCDHALWIDGQGSGRDRFSLELNDGFLRFEPGFWRSPDYSHLLHTGLGQDFAGLGIERIRLHDIDLIWNDEGLAFRAEDTAGEVSILDNGMADASLVTQRLNGVAVGPIEISARFSTFPRLEPHEIVLQLPPISLAALGLDELVGSAISSGQFAGDMQYKKVGGDEIVELRGSLSAARLEEWTARVIGGPYRGRADLTVDGLTVRNRLVSSIRFRGKLSELYLGDFLPVLGRPGLEGRFDLDVHQAAILGDRVEYLSAEGSIRGLSCDALCEVFRLDGEVTGRLDLTIHALQIVNDEIRWADVEAKVSPPADGAGTIDRALIVAAAEEMLGVSVGSVWPKSFSKLEYKDLGVRLLLERGALRVRGTHGSDNETILTVRLFGLNVPVIHQPDSIYAVPDFLSMLRQQVEQIETRDIRQLLEGARGPSASDSNRR